MRAKLPDVSGKGRGMTVFGSDAFSPEQIANRVEESGVAKAHLPFLTTAMLGIMAGAFIAIGSLYYTIVASDATLGFAATRVLGGVVFSVGLLLVLVAGGELFTGNNLLAMAWVDRKISTRELLGNWSVALAANAAGAAGVAFLVVLSGHTEMNGGAIAATAVKIAAAKTSLPYWKAFVAGILCNILVCMAVWLSLAGRSVVDKAVAVVLPISAFVAAGFEHSVANMYFIPLGIFLRDTVDATQAAGIASLDWEGYVRNLVPVTLGNIVGGSGLVALVYYVIYRVGPRNVAESESRNERTHAAVRTRSAG
jgi:formate transporter